MDPAQSQSAFPLAWPIGWQRTEAGRREKAPFFSTTRGGNPGDNYRALYRKERSMDDATHEVLSELRRISAQAVVISTNVQLRQDGLPYSNRRPPDDPGAAVYFKVKGKAAVLACDKWRRVEDNLYAIAKHIEALRGQERWGVGSMEQAFAGYLRLQAPGSSAGAVWYAVIGCSHDATYDQARAAYLTEAKKAHPDSPGGSHDRMLALNNAWDQARLHFGK